MKTQDWVKTSVFFDDICPTISATGVSHSVIMLVPSHAEFFQMIQENDQKAIHTGICIAKHTYRYHCSIPLLHPHDGHIQIEVQIGSTRGRTPQTPGSPDEALDLFLGHILHSSTLFLHPGIPAADRLHEHH